MNTYETNKNTEKKAERRKAPHGCDTCVYYDIIDDDGTWGCVVDIDEDDAYREREDRRAACPYYKFYDEYKSVQKQN
jgi:hypothetical protein